MALVRGGVTIAYGQYAFLLIKPEKMVMAMIRKSKAKLQFCK